MDSWELLALPAWSQPKAHTLLAFPPALCPARFQILNLILVSDCPLLPLYFLWVFKWKTGVKPSQQMLYCSIALALQFHPVSEPCPPTPMVLL